MSTVQDIRSAEPMTYFCGWCDHLGLDPWIPADQTAFGLAVRNHLAVVPDASGRIPIRTPHTVALRRFA